MRFPGWIVVAATSLVLGGCPSSNLYTTARTVAPGKVSISIAPELIGRSLDDAKVQQLDTGDRTQRDVVPVLPTARVRLGITERFDAALIVSASWAVGAELKYNFIRGQRFDLSFAPGYQFSGDQALDGSQYRASHYVTLPAVIDINVHRALTVVLTPGVNVAAFEGDLDHPWYWGRGLMPRMGLGLNLRLFDWISFQPEATMVLPLYDDENPTRVYVYAGLGLSFFNLDKFQDVGGWITEN